MGYTRLNGISIGKVGAPCFAPTLSRFWQCRQVVEVELIQRSIVKCRIRSMLNEEREVRLKYISIYSTKNEVSTFRLAKFCEHPLRGLPACLSAASC